MMPYISNSIAAEKLRVLIAIDKGTTFNPKWKEKYEEREFVRVVRMHRSDVLDRVVSGPYFVPVDKWAVLSKTQLRVYPLMSKFGKPTLPLTVNMRSRYEDVPRDMLVPVPATRNEEEIEGINDLVVQEGPIVDLYLKGETLTDQIKRLEKERSELHWQRDKDMIESARRHLT